MSGVRRPEARWMPSRHNFALFRLAALCGLAAAHRRGFSAPRRDLLFPVDRHQSVFEQVTIAVWITATATAYAAFALSPLLPLPAALLVALPLTLLALELPMFLTGLVVRPAWNALTGSRGENNLRMNSAFLMLVLVALSIPFARSGVWVRYAAMQFLALVALNGVCALVMLALRGTVSRLEEAVGGSASEG